MGKIITIVVLLLFSAYFSATETAFTSLNKIRIKNMANDGDKRARRVYELSEKYDEILSTILVGNNIVNIVLTATATVLFITLYPEYGAALSTVVTALVVLIFGEITPKSLAKENPESFAMFSAPLLKILTYILYPINWIFGVWKKFIALVFKVKSNVTITEDELITLVEEAETEGGIDESQSELIQNAIEFNELTAWDVLTPRVDIQAVEINVTKAEVEEIFVSTGFSRLPVYEDDLDDIKGVLNQKDFTNFVKGKKVSVTDYVKPVVFAAGSLKLSILLKRLQAAKTHMAVIIDEYGGTEGIVTMEDIIEELVGEIYDEHDEEAKAEMVKLKDGSYRVLSSMNLDKMFEKFDVEEDIDCTTVNGWVAIMLDKLPKKGDSFVYEADYKRFDVTVTKADTRKSLEIKMVVTELPREE